MPPIAHTDLIAHLSWRASIRRFDASRGIPVEVWSALEHAMVLAPSSYGLQPWKFLIVQDDAIRRRLRVHAWDQAQVTDCSHLVVFARRTHLEHADVDRFIDRIVQVRSSPRDTLAGLHNRLVQRIEGTDRDDLGDWNARQVYLALGMFLTACAVLGVDACPMEGFEPPAFDDILGLDGSGYASTVVCACGYRAPDDVSATRAKVRFDPADVIVRL